MTALLATGGEHANLARKARMATWRGRSIALTDPRPADIDLIELCEALSGMPRYNNHRRSPWDVGQHSLLADHLASIPALCPEPAARPYVLLHDAHEAYIGDQTTPQQVAFDLELRALYPALPADAFRQARHALAGRWDAAIHKRFGLEWPAPAEFSRIVARIDRFALVVEVRDGFETPADFGVSRDEIEAANRLHPAALRPVPSMVTIDRLWRRFRQVLP
ncbi:MAG: hypothetical protein GC202_02195 [Alphaproteobacteria bacterium]|nr:hypothetical protein [Alphaproteobacteria bacterium]